MSRPGQPGKADVHAGQAFEPDHSQPGGLKTSVPNWRLKGPRSHQENVETPELTSSDKEGKPRPQATAGVVCVPCSSATDRTTTSVARGAEAGLFPRSKPP